MSTVIQIDPVAGEKQGGPLDHDFAYHNNVANASIDIRMGFLRKVLGIVSFQLLLTTIVCVVFMSSQGVQGYVKQSPWMMYLSFFLTLGLLVPLHMFSRKTPHNYLLLLAFTLAESYMVGVLVVHYDASAVIQAAIYTFLTAASLTVYTIQSKRDFSAMGAGLFAALFILIAAGFMQMFIPSSGFNLAVSVGGAIVFSLFIVYDIHMIMKRISAEEYIPAAISLYLDVINLFIYILRIVNEAKK